MERLWISWFNAKENVKDFFKKEEGVTAIEYGLIASLIAVLIIAGATLIGGKLDSVFNYIAGKISTP